MERWFSGQLIHDWTDHGFDPWSQAENHLVDLWISCGGEMEAKTPVLCPAFGVGPNSAPRQAVD